MTGAAPNVNCPPVEIREGASTLAIGPPGDTTTMNLRYQGTFTRQARECTVVDGNMVMKIGVQGRVIVGPAGGVGQVDVPLRVAVVQETPGGTQPIATKFIRIPVAITSTDQGGVFTRIEEGMTFPLPTLITALGDYVVYIGFDPVTAAAQDKEAAQPKPKPKAKPKHKSDTNSRRRRGRPSARIEEATPHGGGEVARGYQPRSSITAPFKSRISAITVRAPAANSSRANWPLP